VTEMPSERLVDQRLRNRAIDALEVLAGGNEGVRAAGAVVDDRQPAWRHLSTYTPPEIAELERVHSLLLDACAETAPIQRDDDFIASGWPERIKPAAADALALMLSRGRFREDREEQSPSPRG